MFTFILNKKVDNIAVLEEEMKALARRTNTTVKRASKRQQYKLRTAPPPPPEPPLIPNVHYEAGWTDSWSHRRCLHKHRTLAEAAECTMPTGAGWYVFAIENGGGSPTTGCRRNNRKPLSFRLSPGNRFHATRRLSIGTNFTFEEDRPCRHLPGRSHHPCN
jgi:hypothetical protein